MKLSTILLAMALALPLAGCGGSDDDSLSLSFGGTVSGNNCFNDAPESLDVAYLLRVGGTASGSFARLTDAQGATWEGSVGDNGAIEVKRPAADERFVIRAYDIFGTSSPRFDVTASCVSFRCCTTLSGTLSAGG
jgi:hypothetical protein